ncbi:MAG: hypothetical protein IPM89_09390 [Candidatus Competibacteraceae bacterium]|nr:MAG: hypothetical protein IPM89_09390 [Candidatus Competibacteraceae bacterium]
MDAHEAVSYRKCIRRPVAVKLAPFSPPRFQQVTTMRQLKLGDWRALETVVDSSQARDLIPHLTAAGAQGILEYELRKIV